jgi:hypothetical protein
MKIPSKEIQGDLEQNVMQEMRARLIAAEE